MDAESWPNARWRHTDLYGRRRLSSSGAPINEQRQDHVFDVLSIGSSLCVGRNADIKAIARMSPALQSLFYGDGLGLDLTSCVSRVRRHLIIITMRIRRRHGNARWCEIVTPRYTIPRRPHLKRRCFLIVSIYSAYSANRNRKYRLIE